MPKPTSQKKQLQILLILILAFICMTAYSFKDRFDIPTQDSIAVLRKRVHERKQELEKATEEARQYRQTIQDIRNDFQRFKYNPTIEREAPAKLDRILDDANVTKTRSNINASHSRGKTNLQQLNINLEFEDLSMRKLADLFETFAIKGGGTKTPLYWTRIAISPRIVRRRNVDRRSPYRPDAQSQIKETRQLNVSATVTTFTLFPNASDLIFTDPKPGKDKKGQQNAANGKKGGK